MARKSLLLALLLLGGCYATASPMYLPDGSSGYRIACGDYVGVTADCIQKAGDICGPNGYQMYDQAGHPLSEQTQNQSVIAALNGTPKKQSRSSSSDQQSAMFIKCKGTQAPMSIITPPPVEKQSLPAVPASSTPAASSSLPPALQNNKPIPLDKN